MLTDTDSMRFWGLRAAKFKQFVADTLQSACQFLGNGTKPPEDFVKTLQLNLQNSVVKQWAYTKNLVDITVIVNDWVKVPELESFNLHITKMEPWPDDHWVYFREMVSGYGLKVVRRRVSNRATAKHRKSKKRDTSSVLFNKYDAPIITE